MLVNTSDENLVRIDDGTLVIHDENLKHLGTIDFATERYTLADGKMSFFVPPAGARKSGEYEVTVYGETLTGYSLKSVLGDALRALEKKKPGSLEKLSKVGTARKHIVARKPEGLFASDTLPKKFAEPLIDGWFYGTNNSAQEVNSWLARAAKAAGAEFGKDITTSF
ncbi:hypothetical protein [Mesorhizobium sp. M0130]|uniref:hypothetical protein n=1 Tax=Mesorhizobium sp. M0130 TaxID=2956887 RepID=UPI00333D140E